MARTTSRVILITGARSGIGRACATALVGQGHRVYGTSRRLASVDAHELGYPLLTMDVDDDDSVRAGVDEVLATAGRLDVVVNNAGFGYGGGRRGHLDRGGQGADGDELLRRAASLPRCPTAHACAW